MAMLPPTKNPAASEFPNNAGKSFGFRARKYVLAAGSPKFANLAPRLPIVIAREKTPRPSGPKILEVIIVLAKPMRITNIRLPYVQAIF